MPRYKKIKVGRASPERTKDNLATFLSLGTCQISLTSQMIGSSDHPRLREKVITVNKWNRCSWKKGGFDRNQTKLLWICPCPLVVIIRTGVVGSTGPVPGRHCFIPPTITQIEPGGHGRSQV